MARWVAFLYGCCFLSILGLVVFIAVRNRRRSGLRLRRLRRSFSLLTLSLLVWQVTYLLEAHSTSSLVQLYLGRANFAIIALTVYWALRFVREVAGRKIAPCLHWFCLIEASILAVITLLTPLVDAAERIELETGRPISQYGLLFPLYLLHVTTYLGTTIVLVIRGRKHTRTKAVRRQLTMIGTGIFLTSIVSIVTNGIIPYTLDDFRFCDVGMLSTLLFVLAVAYAVFVHGLFDLRVLIRETVVYGILLTMMVGAYSTVVLLITQYLTDGADKFTQLLVLLIAFSFDPLKRILEKKVDRLLFDQPREDEER